MQGWEFYSVQYSLTLCTNPLCALPPMQSTPSLIHTHTHTHTHSIYTSSGFPLSEATGTECFRFEIGLFCIFGGKIWRKILQEGRSKAHLCAFLLSSSLTNSYLSQKKKIILENLSGICHLEMTMCVLFHISASSLSHHH